VRTGAAGHVSDSVTLDARAEPGEWITATATGAEGTSELSRAEQVRVVQVATSTALTTSAATPFLGVDNVIFTATVSAGEPGFGVPTGEVDFYEGSTLIGSGLLNGSGVATFGTVGLSVGLHSITAVYTGATDFLPSTGTPTTVNVIPPSSLSGVVFA